MLLIVSDEERRNDWLDGVVDLPAHQRLRADGLSFDRYFTHASPCSPSRASLYTGRYLAEHRVVDNVAFPTHTALDPSIPTIGSLLADQGYRSSYLGKWHLSHGETPDMEAHGYLDWEGNDVHFMGSAYTGRYFDPIIVDQAIDWLRDRSNGNGVGATSQPWFLTVALVNPHDIMWFPADHRSYQAAHPKFTELFDAVLQMRLGDLPVTPPPEDYPRLFDRLPENFTDDLHTKPEIQRAWRHVRNREHMVGRIDAEDHDMWLRGLDYYAWLHTELDAALGRLLEALDEMGLYDETVIAYTSDHGDACGSHGLRAKLPCVYDEVMGVPLIVKAPGVPAGARTHALATHVDLAATVAALGGVNPGDTPTLSGRDLAPVLAGPVRLGARLRAVLAGLGPVRDPPQQPLRAAGLLRRRDQVRPLLRGRRWGAARGNRGRTGQDLRCGRRLRRSRPRVVRDHRRPPRAGEPGPRQGPPQRAARPVPPPAGL